MSYADYVKLWANTLGVKASLQKMSVDDLVTLFPNGLGVEVGQTVCFVNEYGWTGNTDIVLPEEAGIDPVQLTDVASYIRNTDWSSILSQDHLENSRRGTLSDGE